MKKKLLTYSMLASILTAGQAQAELFSFDDVSHNSAVNAAIGESQLFVDVTSVDKDSVLFYFTNAGPEASSITDVYFDQGTSLLLSTPIELIDNSSSGVDFSAGATPLNLPGGSGSLNFSTYLSADSTNPVQPNGVNPGEYLGMILSLSSTGTFDNLITSINDGYFRIGIHVQGFADNGSEVFIASSSPPPAPVPEPASMILLGTGLAGLVGLRRRKKK